VSAYVPSTLSFGGGRSVVSVASALKPKQEATLYSTLIPIHVLFTAPPMVTASNTHCPSQCLEKLVSGTFAKLIEVQTGEIFFNDT
jgi:hypothetical protein